MSQAGIVDIEGSHPQIPTLFVANVGSAIPITNTLEILGSVVDAHGAPIQTVASGNTVNIDVQLASAALSSAVANAGIASFNSADFTVDANGFVSFSSGVFAEDFQVDTSTPPGTNPVEPSGTGTVSITGGQVAAGTTANVIQTNSLMANMFTIQIQRSKAVSSSTIADNGVSHFNSTYFTVDANGFVATNGSGIGSTITGDSGGPLSPTAGNWTFTGGTTGLTFAGAGSTETLGGTLKLANGGTNASLTASNGGIFYSTATAGAILSGTATALQMLQSGASSAPAWSTTTWPATSSINTVLYSSSANVIGQITAADNGVLISGTTGIPSWLAAGTTGQVLVATTSNPASWATLSSIAVTSITATAPLTANTFSGTPESGAVTVALTTPLALNYGGTNANLTASNGGIFYSTASAGAILAGTSTANQMLQSGSSTTPAWSTATWPATTTINDILYSSANNVVGQITAADNGVLISGTTGIPSWLAAGTTGQVLVATTSNPASWGTLSSIAVTSIAGTTHQITASASTGAVTLSIPSTFIAPGTIAATTSVSSPEYLVTGSSSGTISILPQAAAGTYNFNLPTTAGTAGYFLTSDGGGAGGGMTWTQAPSGSVTQYATLVGGASNTISSVGPSATSGAVYIGAGASANPKFSTTVTFNDAGGYHFVNNTAGTNTALNIQNSDSTNSSSGAGFAADVGTSNGTAYYQVAGNSGSTAYTWGMNLAINTNWVLCTTGTIGSGNAIQVTSSGVVSFPAAPLGIASGGTDATSFTQSNGIVTYNGTSLVNYAGPQISSGGIYTNSSQPCFSAYRTSVLSNVTGNNANYQIVFDTAFVNQGNNYSNSTGNFTAPVAGNYLFNWCVSLSGVVSATTCYATLVTSSTNTFYSSIVNPAATKDVNGQFLVASSAIVPLTANATVGVYIQCNGQGANSINVIGGGSAVTYFSGALIC